jgi:hypothetical protein
MKKLFPFFLILLFAIPAAAQITISPAPAASPAPGGSNGQLQINNSGSFGGFTLGGDCTFSSPNITCT